MSIRIVVHQNSCLSATSPSTSPRDRHRRAIDIAARSTSPRDRHRRAIDIATRSTSPRDRHRRAIDIAARSTSPRDRHRCAVDITRAVDIAAPSTSPAPSTSSWTLLRCRPLSNFLPLNFEFRFTFRSPILFSDLELSNGIKIVLNGANLASFRSLQSFVYLCVFQQFFKYFGRKYQELPPLEVSKLFFTRPPFICCVFRPKRSDSPCVSAMFSTSVKI